MNEILAACRRAAWEAAALVHRGYRRRPAVEHKGLVDLVTPFDRASEALLRERLAPLGVPIVGEEEGGEAPAKGLVFFIDPLDGTTNFVHGHPFWCVSIGLVDSGRPVLGVVVSPALGLEWWGADGLAERRAFGHARPGAAIEDASPAWEVEPCRVSEVASFGDALLATGFPVDRRTRPDRFDAFVALKQRCQAIRRCGSAALDLCLVADGTYDGYWEPSLKSWDIAGGSAIVLAAGGQASDFEGTGGFITSGHIVATNGTLHATLLAELASVPTSGLR